MQIETSAQTENFPVTELTGEILGCLPKLRKYAIYLCGGVERADDLVQETVMRALANIHSFQPGTNMIGWLCTVLRNHFYSEYRKRRNEVEDEDGHYAEQMESLPLQEDYLHLMDLRDTLDRLAPDHREALILVGASGLSYGEAAAHCGCAVGTMKSRVNRARNKLALMLALPGDSVPQASITN
jgi:RNA polymerase sigma-70 factor (ECF subfamily)